MIGGRRREGEGEREKKGVGWKPRRGSRTLVVQLPSFLHLTHSKERQCKKEKGREGGRERERKGGGGWMVEGVGKGRKSEIRGEE